MSHANGSSEYAEVPTDRIRPSPTNPRKHFPDEALQELADSIRAKGVLQPLLVRPAHRGPVLDDFTLLEEIAGGDTDRDSVQCAHNLVTLLGVRTYGELKRSTAGLRPNGPPGVWGVARNVSGISQKQARALSRAIAELARDRAAGPAYELVAGERRLRAAKIAGLTAVPVIVRALSDREVLEVQVIENDQRSDVLPSERAAGYQALLGQGVTVEDLAAKVGKSPSFVRGVLLLARMPEALAEAVDAGEVPRSTAELVCRVPNEELREQAARCVLRGAWDPARLDPAWDDRDDDREPLSYRDTRQLIDRHFSKELKGAPFSVKDARLLESAGACTTCPKRTGNDRASYPDGRADVCTDPPCYQEKVRAQAARDEGRARARGIEVLDAETCARLFPYGSRLSSAHYVDLADRAGEPLPWDSPLRKKTWRQVLGEHCPPVHLAHDREGRPHYVVKAAAARKALEASGALKKEKAAGGHNGNGNGKAPRKPGTWEVERRAGELATAAVADMVLANAEGLATLAANGGPGTDAAYEALALAARCVALAELDIGNQEAVVRFVPAVDADDPHLDAAAAVTAWAAKAQPAELLAFLLSAASREQFGTYRADRELRQDLLAYADVRWEDLLKKARKELTREMAPKPKAGRPAAGGAECLADEDAGEGEGEDEAP